MFNRSMPYQKSSQTSKKTLQSSPKTSKSPKTQLKSPTFQSSPSMKYPDAHKIYNDLFEYNRHLMAYLHQSHESSVPKHTTSLMDNLHRDDQMEGNPVSDHRNQGHESFEVNFTPSISKSSRIRPQSAEIYGRLYKDAQVSVERALDSDLKQIQELDANVNTNRMSIRSLRETKARRLRVLAGIIEQETGNREPEELSVQHILGIFTRLGVLKGGLRPSPQRLFSPKNFQSAKRPDTELVAQEKAFLLSFDLFLKLAEGDILQTIVFTSILMVLLEPSVYNLQAADMLTRLLLKGEVDEREPKRERSKEDLDDVNLISVDKEQSSQPSPSSEVGKFENQEFFMTVYNMVKNFRVLLQDKSILGRLHAQERNREGDSPVIKPSSDNSKKHFNKELTFTPTINKVSQQISASDAKAKYMQKIINEQQQSAQQSGHQSGQRSVQFEGSNSGGQHQSPQHHEENGEDETMNQEQDEQHYQTFDISNPLTKRTEYLYLHHKYLQAKREEAVQQKKSTELDNCTFQPKTNKTSSVISSDLVANDSVNAHMACHMHTLQQSAQKDSPTRSQQDKSVYNRLYHQGLESRRLKQIMNENKKKEDEKTELSSCTFKPVIFDKPKDETTVQPPASYDAAGSEYPPDFDRTVFRMRTAQQIKEEKVKLAEKWREKVDRPAHTVTKPKPFNLHSTSRSELKDNSVMLSFEVAVAHGKKGKLVVRKGDNPELVVENFARVYSLTAEAKIKLQAIVYNQIGSAIYAIGQTLRGPERIDQE